jgi:[acyl-carrier-protein] S-malonyltransferase
VSLAYIFDGVTDRPGTGAELYERFPVARKWYEQVQEWTGFDAAEIFTGPAVSREGGFRWAMAPIRQAAAAIAACDILADHGVRPTMVCGFSLGGLIASCVSGAVARRDLIQLLMRMRDAPPPPDPPQGMASLVVPADAKISYYLHDGLYLVGEVGPLGAGDMQLLVVGGYRSAVDELVAGLPAGTVQVFDDIPLARHTPLLQYMSDFIEPYVAATTFRDPEIPLIACMEPRTLTTAEDVRNVFLRQNTLPLRFPYLKAGLEDHDAQLGVVIGPSRVGKHQHLPVPVVHVETPEHVSEAVLAVHELGISCYQAGSARS